MALKSYLLCHLQILSSLRIPNHTFPLNSKSHLFPDLKVLSSLSPIPTFSFNTKSYFPSEPEILTAPWPRNPKFPLNSKSYLLHRPTISVISKSHLLLELEILLPLELKIDLLPELEVLPFCLISKYCLLYEVEILPSVRIRNPTFSLTSKS